MATAVPGSILAVTVMPGGANGAFLNQVRFVAVLSGVLWIFSTNCGQLSRTEEAQKTAVSCFVVMSAVSVCSHGVEALRVGSDMCC